VLHNGRLFTSGELVGLHPLGLRAVVDWQKSMPDTFFEEGGEERMLGLVRGPVEEAHRKVEIGRLTTSEFDGPAMPSIEL
jgi:hypothetical protein